MFNKITISPQRQTLIIYIVLTVVTLTVFWQVNQCHFVNFDDNVYVTENNHIKQGFSLDGLRWAFTTTHAEFWHPLTWLSLMLDYQLYGLKAGGYHLTNLILHILSSLLLFWLFNRMTGMIWRSAFVAAFFALHPLHVESVAWIAERKDVLSAFFWMLTLCLYVYYTEKPAIRRYLLVLFSFVCALMSKPMVVTLPVIVILLDYWPLKRFESKKENWVLWQLKEKIPLFVLSAIFSIVTLFAQHKMSAQDFPLASRLANTSVSFVTYLAKTFWPHNLAIFYPFPNQLPLWQILSASLLILCISAFVLIMMKRLPYLFVGWFWFSITIAPVIGIIQIGNHAMADRYTYLPLIGIAVGLAWGLPLLFPCEDTRKKILFPAAIASLFILSVLTWQQCRYWESSIALFGRALHVTKNNYLAYCQFGYATFSEGKTAEAIEIYNQAIRLKPDYVYAYNNRGNAYAKLGQYQRAIEDYNESIRLSSVGYAQTYINRGNAYAQLGQYQRTTDDYNQALRLKPDDAYAYYNRGTIYHKLGQEQRAVEDLSKAIRLNPDYADAYYNRAIVYLSRGDNISGCNDALKACESGICQILESAKSRGLCR